MDNLKVTLVQANLFWQDVSKNLEHFTNLLSTIKPETDLVILPEMFTTGFTMRPQALAEEHGGLGLQWMIKTAQEKKTTLCGSIAVKEQQHYFNRLYWVRPDGTYQQYNKRHLFRMAGEHEHYQAGEEKIIVKIKGWKICPLVCYDLRFPVWSRNKLISSTAYNPEYDALIYVANWPEVRSYPWKQLLIARAIENQCYVMGVNRIGEDGNQIAHSGDSAVINPRGEIISRFTPHQANIETIELSKSYLHDFRKAFPVLMDADPFELKSL